MQKWLCLAAMIAAGILTLIYGLDLILPVRYAPFSKEGITTDILFVLAGGLILWQGYETWREVA